MKKVVSVFAVLVMSVGVFAYQSESNVESTDALYETSVSAVPDGNHVPTDGRE